MINFLKAKALALVDRIDRLSDPFEQFTRPAYPPPLNPTQTLAMKAVIFEETWKAFESSDGQTVYYEIPEDTRLPYPVGDLALYQGLSVAASALHYQMTGNYDDFKMGWLTGLKNFFVMSPWGYRLIRGSYNGIISDDASNDSATGILVGAFFARNFGPQNARKFAQDVLDMLAQTVCQNEYALIGPTGKPTTYGKLINGWKTDPLRLTLALAILSSSPYTYVHARNLAKTYDALIPYAKVRLWWVDNRSDTHRAAAHLAIVYWQTRYPSAFEGLKRLWAMERKTANPWIMCLARWCGVDVYQPDRLNFKKLLSEFDPEVQKLNVARDNTESTAAFGAKKVLWDGVWMASQPVPAHLKGSDEFAWARNPYSLTSGTTPPSARHNGLGFLLPYWFGRSLSLIGENE